ncbi:hypothetical protein TNCV_4266711 [Trichonephila clavipes]|nr:hypothetical protein TNCV_4266711 [Trichonephila clavipes]
MRVESSCVDATPDPIRVVAYATLSSDVGSMPTKFGAGLVFMFVISLSIDHHTGSFAMRENGGNRRLVPGPDYMVDTLKLPNQAPRGSGESLQKCVA